MKATIQKWGNSLAIRIPKSFAIETRIERDSVVDLSMQNGDIIISARNIKRRYNLDEMLSQITDESIHPETDWGQPVGEEIL
jgi:antitoxin MazE